MHECVEGEAEEVDQSGDIVVQVARVVSDVGAEICHWHCAALLVAFDDVAVVGASDDQSGGTSGDEAMGGSEDDSLEKAES